MVMEPPAPLLFAYIIGFKPTRGESCCEVPLSVRVRADYPRSGVKSAPALSGIRLRPSKTILLSIIAAKSVSYITRIQMHMVAGRCFSSA